MEWSWELPWKPQPRRMDFEGCGDLPCSSQPLLGCLGMLAWTVWGFKIGHCPQTAISEVP